MKVINCEKANEIVEKLCEIHATENKKIRESKFRRLFEGENKQYWAAYGERHNKPGRYRIDFCVYVEQEKRAALYAKLEKELSSKYNVVYTKSKPGEFHIYFVRDIPYAELDSEMLNKAVLEFLEFMKKDFVKVKKIIEKS